MQCEIYSDVKKYEIRKLRNSGGDLLDIITLTRTKCGSQDFTEPLVTLSMDYDLGIPTNGCDYPVVLVDLPANIEINTDSVIEKGWTVERVQYDASKNPLVCLWFGDGRHAIGFSAIELFPLLRLSNRGSVRFAFVSGGQVEVINLDFDTIDMLQISAMLFAEYQSNGLFDSLRARTRTERDGLTYWLTPSYTFLDERFQ
jgi:hypothetical protein